MTQSQSHQGQKSHAAAGTSSMNKDLKNTKAGSDGKRMDDKSGAHRNGSSVKSK